MTTHHHGGNYGSDTGSLEMIGEIPDSIFILAYAYETDVTVTGFDFSLSTAMFDSVEDAEEFIMDYHANNATDYTFNILEFTRPPF